MAASSAGITSISTAAWWTHIHTALIVPNTLGATERQPMCPTPAFLYVIVILLPNMALAASPYLSKTKLSTIRLQSHSFPSSCVRHLELSSQFHSSKFCHFQMSLFSSLLIFIIAHICLTDRLWACGPMISHSSRNTGPEPQGHLERAQSPHPTSAHTLPPADCVEGMEQSWQGHTVWFCCRFKLGLSFYV